MKLVLALKRFQTTKTATVSQAPTKLKRFWKTAGIQEQNLGYQILLDNRTLKTSGGISVVIPKERKTLAILTAAEWETQGEFLKSYSLPLVWLY